MDFIFGLPMASMTSESILVIVDCLTNLAHVILVKTTHGACDIAGSFVQEMVTPHGITKEIVVDWNPSFLQNFGIVCCKNCT